MALVALLLGYRTRLAAFWAFVLLASIHVRTPPLLQAGDTLLRVLFFWSLFLPLGARCSLDARPQPAPQPAEQSVATLGDASTFFRRQRRTAPPSGHGVRVQCPVQNRR